MTEDTQMSPQRIASALLAAAREESFETAVNAACGLVFHHWDGGLTHRGALYVSGDGSLRTLSAKAQDRMQGVILKYLEGANREQHLDVFEELLGMLNNRQRGVGLQHGTLPLVAELLANIIGPGDSVLDPACGFGGSLLAAARSWPRKTVGGVELDPIVAEIAANRMALAGIDGEIRVGDWFEQSEVDRGKWDCIVVEPPLGVRTMAAGPGGELAWMERVADSLTESGRGAVLLGAQAAVRGGGARELRQRLLREGRLTAVVELPPRSILQSSTPTCLFVVRGGADERKDGKVLLMSVSSAEWDLARSLTSACRDWIVDAVVPDLPPTRARVIGAEELIAGNNCLPSNYLETETEGQDFTVPTVAAVNTQQQLLCELRLQNFKSIGDQVSIPLRPLTLVFGKNSAGKSSILQSLLLMKQSIEEQVLNPYGPYARLGSYQSLIHRHESDRDLGWGVTFGSPANVDRPVVAPGVRRSVDITFTWDANDERAYPRTVRGVLEGRQVRWELDRFQRDRFELANAQLRKLADSDEKDRTQGGGVQAESVYRRLWSTVESAGFSTLAFDRDGLLPGRPNAAELEWLRERGGERPLWTSSSIELLQRMGDFVQSVDHELRDLLRRMVYLGPLREAPTRLSQRSASEQELDIPFHLLHNLSERQQVSQYLRELGMNYQLDAVPVTTPNGDSFVGELAGLVLTDTRTGVRLSPSDVGFGISQVLPIVVELSARSDSVIMIEQPEIHLHPAMQAALADVLIESVAQSGRANQVIAETHSENLVLRLQRRIREGAIDSDSVAILYVDQDSEGQGKVQHLRLSDTGEFIDEWPHGFFEEQFDELFGGL